MFTSLKRVIQFGWQGFVRNKGLSFQVIFIMVIGVLFVTSLFIAMEVSVFLIEKVQGKVDIAVYFKKDASEERILEVKEELSKLSGEIKSVEFVSEQEALESFTQEHKDEPDYLVALEELDDNPFLASLNIKAHQLEQYTRISRFLEKGPFSSLIEKISYHKNKQVIDKLFSITSNIKTGGIILSLILGLLVVLVTFNIIKLTILASKEEIYTMRLVGAANWFIRAPFLIQSILYGTCAVLIANLIFFVGLSVLDQKLTSWFLDFNFLIYFQKNFFTLLLIQIVFAEVFGMFATSLAVSRYLKV